MVARLAFASVNVPVNVSASSSVVLPPDLEKQFILGEDNTRTNITENISDTLDDQEVSETTRNQEDSSDSEKSEEKHSWNLELCRGFVELNLITNIIPFYFNRITIWVQICWSTNIIYEKFPFTVTLVDSLSEIKSCAWVFVGYFQSDNKLISFTKGKNAILRACSTRFQRVSWKFG